MRPKLAREVWGVTVHPGSGAAERHLLAESRPAGAVGPVSGEPVDRVQAAAGSGEEVQLRLGWHWGSGPGAAACPRSRHPIAQAQGGCSSIFPGKSDVGT